MSDVFDVKQGKEQQKHQFLQAGVLAVYFINRMEHLV